MKNLIVVLLMIFTCVSIFPQTWQSMGIPEGSGVTDMVYWKGGAPLDDKLWVTTGSYDWPTGQRGGVFYSATTPPYQGTWYRIGGSAGYYVGRTLAVGQDGNLYASLWRDPSQFPADALCRLSVQAATFGVLYQAQLGDNIFSIAVKNNPHTIFGGTRNGIIRSTDNGTTFGYSNTGIPDSAWVYDIAIDSSGILAIASSKGVFISTDNGDNWLTATGIPPEDTVKTLLFTNNPENKSSYPKQNGGTLSGGTVNGKDYESYLNSLYTEFTLFVLFSPEVEVSGEVLGVFIDFNRRYVGTRKKNTDGNDIPDFGDTGGVYESTDDGITWNQINNGLPSEPPVSALAIKVINETFGQLYAGLFNDTTNGAGVYKLDITVDVEETDNEIPSSYRLEQNYPNPFNPSTTIQFSIPEQTFVKLEVFNSLGEKVSTPVSEELNTGNYKIEWEAKGLPSGIYFYKLRTSEFEQTKKLVLLK
jgi:hypothetical protein